MSETQILTAEERAELIVRVDASYLQDPQRARDSMQNHSATALRKRVLAAQNGSSSNLGLRKEWLK